MKKLLIFITFVLVFGALAFAADNKGAVVINRGTGLCGMVGADANGDIIPGAGIGVTKVTLENGNKIMLKCDGRDIPNDSGKGQEFSGFLCGIIAPDGVTFVTTTDSHGTVSASGVGTLTCTYKK